MRGNFAGKIEELNQELDEIRTELNELRSKADYQDLTELEKEEITFEKAQDISIEFFEKLKKGQKVSLISGSYYYPNENILISMFEYKHDHIDYDNKSKYRWEVHGYEKGFDDDEWSSCTFITNETECSTFSCSGTVKKI